jgi:uncharacterized protein
MASWDVIKNMGEVEDRRGVASTAIGVSSVGAIVILGIMLLTGNGSSDDILNVIDSLQQKNSSSQTVPFEDTKKYKEFASRVIGSTNQVWTEQFAKENLKYKPPKLVLFRNSTTSACGGADSNVGPHYCPPDQTIYLDETFFEVLRTKFGAKGGEVAEAYVMAHEVGHHIQEITGVTANINPNDNEFSIKLELQADCYAGVWAGVAQSEGIIEITEIEQAIDAASAVGDDRIQKKATGRINPETWTHGSSEQRKEAFIKGYNSKDNNICNI